MLTHYEIPQPDARPLSLSVALLPTGTCVVTLRGDARVRCTFGIDHTVPCQVRRSINSRSGSDALDAVDHLMQGRPGAAAEMATLLIHENLATSWIDPCLDDDVRRTLEIADGGH